MKFEEIKLSDRCWIPIDGVPVREDGTNATVSGLISSPNSKISQIDVVTDTGTTFRCTPGLSVFWSRPKDEQMPKIPRMVKKTLWANVYRNITESTGISIGKMYNNPDEAHYWRSMHINHIAIAEITWNEPE